MMEKRTDREGVTAILQKKYLFSDMDGTLLTNDKKVSAENLAAIRRFVEAGGYFGIATGRSENIAAPFLKDIPMNLPAILYNGAAVYDFSKEAFLYQAELERSLVIKMATLALEVYPEVCAEVYTNGIIQLLNRDCVMDHYIPRENQKFEYKALDDFGLCMKLLFYGENAKLKEVERKLYEVTAGAGLQVMFSAPYYLELLPSGATKGSALSWIVENLGIDPDDTAAIGDFYNDVALIETASIGAAPANAPEDVKECANVIVADNEHSAVADFIGRYLFEHK